MNALVTDRPTELAAVRRQLERNPEPPPLEWEGRTFDDPARLEEQVPTWDYIRARLDELDADDVLSETVRLSSTGHRPMTREADPTGITGQPSSCGTGFPGSRCCFRGSGFSGRGC